MDWTTSLVVGLGGLTTTIATVAISAVIVLVISQLAILAYRRLITDKNP